VCRKLSVKLAWSPSCVESGVSLGAMKAVQLNLLGNVPAELAEAPVPEPPSIVPEPPEPPVITVKAEESAQEPADGRASYEEVLRVLEELYTRLEVSHPGWGQRRGLWHQGRADALEVRGWTEAEFYAELTARKSV